jgi:hypothetical protein
MKEVLVHLRDPLFKWHKLNVNGGHGLINLFETRELGLKFVLDALQDAIELLSFFLYVIPCWAGFCCNLGLLGITLFFYYFLFISRRLRFFNWLGILSRFGVF